MEAPETHMQPFGQWQPEPAAGGTVPDSVLAGWLAEAGLLTQRLRRACPDDFRVEVLLRCGDRACVYAVTEVPPATLAAHPWLAELGGEPLGETLQRRAGVSRSDFEFALLDPAGIAALAGIETAPVWARRSRFSIDAAELTVTEVFLGALHGCDA